LLEIRSENSFWAREKLDKRYTGRTPVLGEYFGRKLEETDLLQLNEFLILF
jgi:hypothetical protein